MKIIYAVCVFMLATLGCTPAPTPSPTPSPAPTTSVTPTATAMTASSPYTEARARNDSASPTIVFATFGADSKVRPADWSTFCSPVPSGCSFPLASKATRDLPTGGKYLSANLSFNAPGSCAATGVSLGEVTINGAQNGKYDTTDISLVNGWNADLEIEVSGARTLGPTHGAYSGTSTYGVFPNGCDLCVAKQHPPCPWQHPCGSPDGGGLGCGCHAGSQYNPSPVCQVTGVARGSVVTVVLL